MWYTEKFQTVLQVITDIEKVAEMYNAKNKAFNFISNYLRKFASYKKAMIKSKVYYSIYATPADLKSDPLIENLITNDFGI